MNEIIKMKDKMLDDQNVSIQNLKNVIKQRDEEIVVLRESKSKYKNQYDDKLQQAYDDYDRAKQKCDELEQRV